jgi:hypothetical protein
LIKEFNLLNPDNKFENKNNDLSGQILKNFLNNQSFEKKNNNNDNNQIMEETKKMIQILFNKNKESENNNFDENEDNEDEDDLFTPIIIIKNNKKIGIQRLFQNYFTVNVTFGKSATYVEYISKNFKKNVLEGLNKLIALNEEKDKFKINEEDINEKIDNKSSINSNKINNFITKKNVEIPIVSNDKNFVIYNDYLFLLENNESKKIVVVE